MIRRPHPRVLLAAAAVLSVAACEEERITLDSGDPSTLDVLVYVDANGNGTFDAGDEAIVSAVVTATGPADLTAETGADGVATFEGVVPGSYMLSVAADPPTGAVLATATNPVVVAPFQGAELEAEFRFSFEPGVISGRLFRDDNENEAFDPETDLAAAGIGVTAVRGSDGAVLETTTGSDGTFELAGLRPGTYTVTFDLPEDADLVGGESFTVEVGSTEVATLDAIFTGDLVVDIARARAAPEGQSVTVEGVITWAPGFDDRALFLQDETGGISVFSSGLPDGLEEGHRVRLTGERGSFDGEVQISPVSAFEVLETGVTVAPRQVSASEINAGEFQGELVSIDGTVEQVDVLSFGNQMVLLRHESGETFAVKVDSRTGVEADAWMVGEVYGVTGVLGTDVSESGTEIDAAHPHRVEVRSPDDLQLGGATVDIATARGAAEGTVLTVEGTVTWHPSYNDRMYYLQDETGGIAVFDSNRPDIDIGDRIKITGTRGAFDGEVQISSVSDLDIISSGVQPTPVAVDAAGVNDGGFTGELVTIDGTLQSVDVRSFGNQYLVFQDGAGTEFSVFVDSRIGVESSFWTVGETYSVTGVVAADDDEVRLFQIEPRMPSDVAEVDATPSIQLARGSDGETVTVQGVVTRQTPWDSRVYFFQDASGGISTFHSGAPDLSPGDRIEVSGEISSFRGEVQVGPSSATVLGTTTVPDALEVTGDQINRGLFQGMLVTVTGTVVDVDVVNSFGTQVVTMEDAAGTRFPVFVDNRSGLAAEDWTVGEEVTVVGVLGTDDRDDLPARLEVLLETDVTFAP